LSNGFYVRFLKVLEQDWRSWRLFVGTVMAPNSPVRAFDPDRLGVLVVVYDECLQELLTWYSVSEPSELNGMELVLARRIMGAAQRGILDPLELRNLALTGLLPASALMGRSRAAE
jgi:hypothetical protein